MHCSSTADLSPCHSHHNHTLIQTQTSATAPQTPPSVEEDNDDDDDDDQHSVPSSMQHTSTLSTASVYGTEVPMDPAVEALICQSILSDQDDEDDVDGQHHGQHGGHRSAPSQAVPSESHPNDLISAAHYNGIGNGHSTGALRPHDASGVVMPQRHTTLTDPGLVAAWQQAHDAALAAAAGSAAVNAVEEQVPPPELTIHDLTDPRPGVAAIEGPLDDPEQEIALKEVFPAAFDAALQDCNQWSRIIR